MQKTKKSVQFVMAVLRYATQVRQVQEWDGAGVAGNYGPSEELAQPEHSGQLSWITMYRS